MSQRVDAQSSQGVGQQHNPAEQVDILVRQLGSGSLTVVDDAGKVLGASQHGSAPARMMREHDIVATLRAVRLTPEQAASLWDALADEDNEGILTLPVIEALVTASNTPKTREPMWSELAGLLSERKKRSHVRARSLLSLFERHRDRLRPLITEQRETESSGDEIVELMLATRVLGPDFDDSLAWVGQHDPSALARRMERDRGRGRPVVWEDAAFKHLLHWKDTHLVPGAAKAPRSLAELDAAGFLFIAIFNCLHDMHPKYRQSMLSGLGPVEVFNAVVGGEIELYRMGTSSYRDHLHDIIMRGMTQSGSFEEFLDAARPQQFSGEPAAAAAHRGMVLLRVVSSFGLLDAVLAQVGDSDRFIVDAIAAAGDPTAFEGNSSVLVDVLTSQAGSSSATSFRRALLAGLYARYHSETSSTMRAVYGSMLSVYQTVTGDRRDGEIDRQFPLDDGAFRVPFDRLFSADESGRLVHRMFMRMDRDVDAVATYAKFRNSMRLRGALVRSERHFDIYIIKGRGRAIEIYANKPSVAGVKNGIADIAAALRGRRVETVIGRGHTSIIAPLQENAKRLLGERIKDVSAVLVGACGGDASVRDLISTFGYTSFFTTRSTGRLVINNAIIERYIAALMALPHGGRLSLEQVLTDATARFMRKGGDEELRDDASFYRLAMAAVLTSYLFDTHVHRLTDPDRQVARR